jgi:hypothetical protein
MLLKPCSRASRLLAILFLLISTSKACAVECWRGIWRMGPAGESVGPMQVTLTISQLPKAIAPKAVKSCFQHESVCPDGTAQALVVFEVI